MDLTVYILLSIKFFLATIIGTIIGLDREKRGKPAGMKTHALVCLGSTIVTQIGILMFKDSGTGDQMRVAAQIVSGIGFLGAGVIMTKNDTKVVGLTTAATLWLCGCMGICIGSDYYLLSIPAFISYWFISHIIAKIEKQYNIHKQHDNKDKL